MEAVEAAVAEILNEAGFLTVAEYCRRECARQGKEPPPMYEYEDRYAVQQGATWLLRAVYSDGTPYIKNTGMRPDSAEYPDDPVEAARRLAAHAKERANPLTTPATLDIPLAQIGEGEETPAHEGPLSPADPVSVEGAGDHDARERADDPPIDDASGGGEALPIDADFSDLGAEILEENGPQFVFGDNLDQMRTAAIGLVMRAALARMPAWTDTDTARLSELRNFAMGVSEGRWADDAGSRAWLEELEARLRLRSQIVSCRDTKVEFLNEASRSEVMAFDPESDWP
jgi:hypothetical protein